MLARNAYGTSLGENSYGGLGQPRKSPKAAQPMPSGTGLPGPEAGQQGAGMDMSAYSPGRARPVPPPSQGTPFQAYAPQQQAGPNGGAMTPQGERWYSLAPEQPQQHGAGMNMSAYSPGRARPVPEVSQGSPLQAYNQSQNGTNSSPYSAYSPSSSSYSTYDGGVPRSFTSNAYQNSNAGNYGNSPYGRPDPVSYTATGIGGQQFSDPQQAFAQRDAMIQRINEARAPMFAGAGTYLGDGAPPPTWGQKPPLDFNTLIGQANDMVAGGWQNPFAVTAPGAPPPPAMRDGGMTQFQWSQNNPGNPMANNQPPQFGGGYPQPPQQFLPNSSNLTVADTSWHQPQGRPMVPVGWEGRKGSDRYASVFEPGSEEWHQEMSRRAQAAQAAERPVATPSRPSPSAPRQPAMPLNPRAASDAARAGGGNRQDAREAWRSAYRASVASPSNQRWLNSLSPNNRRIYQMMQAY